MEEHKKTKDIKNAKNWNDSAEVEPNPPAMPEKLDLSID